MLESDRGEGSQHLGASGLLRLRCFGEAVRAIEIEAGLRWCASLESVVSQEIEASYSVMAATRGAFGPSDFAVFFLGHLSEVLPRRSDREAARIGMMRYIVAHRIALGADLAALADEAEAALDGSDIAPPFVARRRRGSDGQSVSEAFLAAYGSLRPALTGGSND
ncbi:MAG: hypothetical protein AAGK37_22845 [Pseudomonadota bacterium]